MKFKPVKIKHPVTGVELWYPRVVTDKEATIDQIVKRIEKFSTLSEPDIRGAILAMENVACDLLSEGRIVRFDKLGSLYPSVTGFPSASPEEVSASSIKRVKVNYRPGKRILEYLQAAKKNKI